MAPWLLPLSTVARLLNAHHRILSAPNGGTWRIYERISTVMSMIMR